MAENIPQDNLFPDEALAMADALAERAVQRTNYLNEILADIGGTPFYEPDQELQKQQQMGSAVIMLVKVSDPSIPYSLSDFLVRTDDDFANLRHYAVELQEAGIDVNVDSLSEAQSDTIDILADAAGLNEDFLVEDFKKGLLSIRAIAKELNLPVVEVIEEDEFYYEAMSKAQSIDEFAEQARKVIKTIAHGIVASSAEPIINLLVASEELTEEMSSEEIECLKNDIFEEVAKDPDLRSTLDNLSEATRQSMVHFSAKAYGTDETKKAILEDQDLRPTKPMANIVVNALLDNIRY